MNRLWWGFGIFLVAAATVICLVPMQELPGEFSINDKINHVIGHAGLAAWFTGLVPRRNWWKIFLSLLLFGICIEFAQYYMHVGRNGDPRDVLANSVGAVLGLTLGRLGLARWPEFAAWLLGRRAAP
jgi:VanZ family protein